jgi:hypothetical protein
MLSAFQLLVKNTPRKITQGKSPLPLEILRRFQAERRATGLRVHAVEGRLLQVIVNQSRGV